MKRVLAIAALVLAAAVPATAAAAPGRDDDVVRRGACTGATTWKLKLSPEDGRIETEFEVDQNRVGRRWLVEIRRNGTRVFRGIRTTRGPSGSFELRRLLGDPPGRTRVVVRARALAGGETCVGAAAI